MFFFHYTTCVIFRLGFVCFALYLYTYMWFLDLSMGQKGPLFYPICVLPLWHCLGILSSNFYTFSVNLKEKLHKRIRIFNFKKHCYEVEMLCWHRGAWIASMNMLILSNQTNLRMNHDIRHIYQTDFKNIIVFFSFSYSQSYNQLIEL